MILVLFDFLTWEMQKSSSREGSSSVLTGKFLNDCLKKYSRFQLIHMVAQRSEELRKGAKPLVESRFTSPVEVALQEIAEGKLVPAPGRKPGTVRAIPAQEKETEGKQSARAQQTEAEEEVGVE